MKPNKQTLKAVYWTTTILLAAAYLMTGIGNLLPFTHIAQDMAHLGYPNYFLKIIGTWKVLAAIVIPLPRNHRLKEWAYAGMVFDLTGAAASRLAIGDSASSVIVPLIIAGITLTSWALQPHTHRPLTNFIRAVNQPARRRAT